jgi:hypothetical protein
MVAAGTGQAEKGTACGVVDPADNLAVRPRRSEQGRMSRQSPRVPVQRGTGWNANRIPLAEKVMD